MTSPWAVPILTTSPDGRRLESWERFDTKAEADRFYQQYNRRAQAAWGISMVAYSPMYCPFPTP